MFSQGCTRSWETPPDNFQNSGGSYYNIQFKPYLTSRAICDKKIENSQKLLLTVATESFALNVTGFPDMTLENIYLDQGNKIFHPAFTCSNSAKKTKKTRNMSNIFKVNNNKDTSTMSVASIVNFEHILQFILMLLINSNK